jgi:DNA-binding beta-propeller fold protein YncE
MKVEIWKIIGILIVAVFVLSAALAHATPTLSATSTISVQGNLAYDSGKGEIFVQNGIEYSQIQVISDSTDQVLTTISTSLQVDESNNGIVYDSGQGEIFASSGNAGYGVGPAITVVSDSSNTIVATLTPSSPGSGYGFPGQPGQMAYDSGKGEIFVTDNNGYATEVYVISDSDNTVLTSIGVGGGLEGLVYDPGTSEVFVAYSGVEGLPGGIAVISDSTNAVVTTINVTASALAYDPSKAEIFAYDYNTVSVISDSTNSVVATITGITEGLTNMAYDSGKGEIFAGGQVISASTNAVVSQLPIGVSGQVVYDSGVGETFAVTNIGMSVFSDSSSSSTTPSPTSTVSTTVSTSTSPTPKVPEFSSAALISVMAAMVVVTFGAVAVTVRTRKKLRK